MVKNSLSYSFVNLQLFPYWSDCGSDPENFVKSSFTCSSFLMHSLTSGIWSLPEICQRTKLQVNSFHLCIKTLIALFAVKSAYSFSWKIHVLGYFLIVGTDRIAELWMLFLETLFKTLKLFKLFDIYSK